MANISDIIEKFLLDALSHNDSMDISRNELANYFNVAPSQINYVLSTRFTTDRGFEVVSQRGGSGYIRLIKLDFSNDDYIKDLISNRLKNPIDYNSAKQVLLNLKDNNIISESEYDIILTMISQKALSNPFNIEDKLRSQIMKTLMISLLSRVH